MRPARSLSRAAGVTLMELLIAVSLVGLLSTGMLMAIRVGLNAMGKANAKLLANRRALGVQRILEQQVAGFVPVIADCRTGPEAPASRQPFFQGEPQSMRFVSTYSLEEAARGYPRILEFQVIPGEENRGVRLVVNEFLYSGSSSAGLSCLGLMPDPVSGVPALRFRPIETGPRSFVLADKLAFCNFLYQEIMPPPLLERWTPRAVKPPWPPAVRIEMAPLEPDPSRVQVVSFTAPIRVNRDPAMQYVD